MNDTRFTPPPIRRACRARRIIVLTTVMLAALGLWALNWGCADPRTEPLAAVQPGYTETIDLFNMAAMGSTGYASTNFTVQQDLAPISVPTMSPARLSLVEYIAPDCQIYRREQIMLDSIPYLQASEIVPAQAALGPVKDDVVGTDSVKTKLLDSLETLLTQTLDSLRGTAIPYTNSEFAWRGQTYSCDTTRPFAHMIPDSASPIPDTTGIDSTLAALDSTLELLEMQFFKARLDTTILGLERDYLGIALDTYYALSIALDSVNTFYVPNAVYVDATGRLKGQDPFNAAVDTTTGLIGRGFLLDLGQLQAADITHIGHTIEVNWATCFSGSSSPCLAPGVHTLYVRLAGPQSRVTGTIVLVYGQRT
jgi:hypothetical protein